MRTYAFATGLWFAALHVWASGEAVRLVVLPTALVLTWFLSAEAKNKTARKGGDSL